MSSLSQVNPKPVLLQMFSNFEVISSRVVQANPFLVAVHILVKQMVTSFESFGKALVLQTETVMSQALIDINLWGNKLVTDFSKSVTWVNQWWQALKSVFKPWLPSNDRQGRTSASHFLELSAFIRTFHWLRGEEREKVQSWVRKCPYLESCFAGCAWESFFNLWIWLERWPNHASASYNGRSAGQR